MCCEYWKYGKPTPCWNTGWIIDVLKFVFWFFRKLSVINCITLHILKPWENPSWEIASSQQELKRNNCAYRAVDYYIALWLFVAIGFSFIVSLLTLSCEWNTVFLILASYGLFEIFQKWVGDFITEDPHPQDPKRTLVATFIAYAEIVLLYFVLVFILKSNFEIRKWQQALYYAMTLGAGTDFKPDNFLGFVIFGTQLAYSAENGRLSATKRAACPE